MSKKKKKHLFKIIPDSIVKGDAKGHLVCETVPEHPYAISLPDRQKKYIYLHRVVMDNSLGYVTDPEKIEIHHKDDNPENNALSNLVMKSHSEHAREHSKKKKFWKKSPENKPSHKSALRVVSAFLKQIIYN
jgi:hypothetical protein